MSFLSSNLFTFENNQLAFQTVLIEGIGWLSTGLFLFSILTPRRSHLHALGVLSSITTGIYAYAHGATAIWVKWLIALFFHTYMLFKTYKSDAKKQQFQAQKN